MGFSLWWRIKNWYRKHTRSCTSSYEQSEDWAEHQPAWWILWIPWLKGRVGTTYKLCVSPRRGWTIWWWQCPMLSTSLAKRPLNSWNAKLSGNVGHRYWDPVMVRPLKFSFGGTGGGQGSKTLGQVCLVGQLGVAPWGLWIKPREWVLQNAKWAQT